MAEGIAREGLLNVVRSVMMLDGIEEGRQVGNALGKGAGGDFFAGAGERAGIEAEKDLDLVHHAVEVVGEVVVIHLDAGVVAEVTEGEVLEGLNAVAPIEETMRIEGNGRRGGVGLTVLDEPEVGGHGFFEGKPLHEGVPAGEVEDEKVGKIGEEGP